MTRKRPNTKGAFPLPAELVDEITSYFDLQQLWQARGINRAFSASCSRRIERLVRAITLWIRSQQVWNFFPVPRYPANPTLLRSPNTLLSWTFDVLLNPSLTVRSPFTGGEITLRLEFNDSDHILAASVRPRKTWARPRSRLGGDVNLPVAEPTDVKALWYDPRDGRLASGIIKRPVTSVKCVWLPDEEFQVLIPLAEIMRCIQHTLKFESSRDFVPMEFMFPFNRVEKSGNWPA